MDIAKRILYLCDENKISVYKLADISEVTQSTVHNIVSGRNVSMLVSTLEKICVGLGITMKEFFDEDAKQDLPLEALKELRAFEEYLRNKYKIKKPGK